MNSIRMAVVAAAVLLAGAAQAAVGAAAHGWTQEDARVALSAQVGAPSVDLTSCSLDAKVAEAQQLKVLAVPDQDRGPLAVSGPCASAPKESFPTHNDDRYRR